MKRVILVAFVIAAISSMVLPMFAMLVGAVNSNYSVTVYGGADSTFDGKWTTNTEWDDAATAQISSDAIFRIKYFFGTGGGGGFVVYDEYLVEFFSDRTNDTGDYVSIAYDCSANGGTAPQSDDIRIDYVGHNGTIVTYKGTGSAWAPAPLVDYTAAELVSISKLNGTNPHWTLELRIEKTQNGPDINNAIRVAVYDASNPSAGVKAWPPNSSLTVVNDYGADPADTTNAIPEGFGFGTVMILSSAAMIIGVIYLRRSKKSSKL